MLGSIFAVLPKFHNHKSNAIFGSFDLILNLASSLADKTQWLECCDLCIFSAAIFWRVYMQKHCYTESYRIKL